MTSSILVRNKLLTHKVQEQALLGPLRPARLVNPYGELDARKAAMLLVWLNGRRGWVAIRPAMSYTRETKKLLQDFGHEVVEKSMLEAARCAKHPWGVRFVRSLCERE